MSPPQLQWLRDDLAKATGHTFVFSHYGLIDDGLGDAAEARKIFREANMKAGFQKVVACFAGHRHVDEYRLSEGVHYVTINSASFYWLGEEYGPGAYRDPLYAVVTVRPDGSVQIEGKTSEFASPTPTERGFPGAARVSTKISDRLLHFPVRLPPPTIRARGARTRQDHDR